MKEYIAELGDSVKQLLDAISVLTAIGALMSFIPSIAALFTIVWTGIRIYESDTVQELLGKKDAE